MRIERPIATELGKLPLELVESLDKLLFRKRIFHWRDWRGGREMGALCFSLKFPDQVLYALFCQSNILEGISIHLNEAGKLILRYGIDQERSLGNPERGGIGRFGYEWLVDVGGNYISSHRSNLRGRGLLVDPIYTSQERGHLPVIAIGLQEAKNELSLFKIVNPDNLYSGYTLAEFVVNRLLGTEVR